MGEVPALLCCDEARACVIIPVYNNGATVGDVVRDARSHCSTVLVCDDGSTDGSGQMAAAAGAIVLRHPRNEGKGVALRTLLSEAKLRGFRHAISMDADGQHLAVDLPTFAKALVDEPGAFVLGTRDLKAAGAPASSEFGRRSSNWWIWFETGLRLSDTQSGFRAYPLPEACDLGAGHRRYEFETDVLLRAAWAGIPIRSRPIRVVYPPGRVSHFRLVLDNVRIVALNTGVVLRHPLPLPLGKSFFRIPRRPGWSLFEIRRWAWLGGPGPLWKGLAAATGVVSAGQSRLVAAVALAVCAIGGVGAVPVAIAALLTRWLLGRGVPIGRSAALIAAAYIVFGALELVRAPRQVRPAGWTGKSRGGVFGHWFFVTLTRAFGRSVAYWVIFPVTLYFLFAAPAATKASRQFLERAIGPSGWWRSMARSYGHLLAFARTMVDRALLRTRGKTAFSYIEVGVDQIHQAAVAGKGAVLLTAHVGNWEVAAGLLEGSTRDKLAVAAYPGEREAIAEFLRRAGGLQLRVIEVGRDVLTSLEMLRELRGGTLLAMHGDRTIGDQVVSVPFLGREARFPVGPFLLSALSGAPLIATFSMQVGPAQYRFFADEPQRLTFVAGRDREAQLLVWVQKYVTLLENVVRQSPYQWFNFYDFWDAPPPRAVSRLATVEAA